MQFILNEDEYRKLIHKDRITGPIKEFETTVTKLLQSEGLVSYSSIDPRIKNFFSKIGDAIKTLNIKLDL